MSTSFVLDASVAAKLWLQDEAGCDVDKGLLTVEGSTNRLIYRLKVPSKRKR